MDKLPSPFFVLAPMDDVTDVAFRSIVASCAAPDLYFTEFVNVDGLQSPGRSKLLPRLRIGEGETKLIAQLWGKTPDNYYKTVKELVDHGYAGIDINFGCPDKTVVKNGCCSAFILPENRVRAVEIIKAVQEAAGDTPVSVKTRLGFNEVDLSWHELLLKQKLNMLTIHGRTRKEMSKVPADWSKIAEIRALRDSLSPETLIVGNGDVTSREQGEELARQHGVDGVMIGRGVLHDPFCFAKDSPWPSYSPSRRIELFRRHVELFQETWQNGERRFETLKKFAKLYLAGFEGVSEIRDKAVRTNNIEELLQVLS